MPTMLSRRRAIDEDSDSDSDDILSFKPFSSSSTEKKRSSNSYSGSKVKSREPCTSQHSRRRLESDEELQVLDEDSVNQIRKSKQTKSRMSREEEDEQVVARKAASKVEKAILPSGITSSDQLVWHQEYVDAQFHCFPARICDPSDAFAFKHVPNPDKWDSSRSCLIEFLEYPPERRINHFIVSKETLIPCGSGSEIWCPEMWKKYEAQRKLRARRDSVAVRKSDLVACRMFLDKILKLAKAHEEENGKWRNKKYPPPEEVDSDDLEEPYTQNLGLPQSDSDSDFPMDDKAKEPLHAGDVITYCSPIYRRGDSRGKRTATVLSVDPDRHPILVLDNTDVLPDDTMVKRIKVKVGDTLHDHPGVFRTIETFRMTKESVGNIKDAVRKESARLGAIVKRNVSKFQSKVAKEGLGPTDIVLGAFDKKKDERSDQQHDSNSDSDSIESPSSIAKMARPTFMKSPKKRSILSDSDSSIESPSSRRSLRPCGKKGVDAAATQTSTKPIKRHSSNRLLRKGREIERSDLLSRDESLECSQEDQRTENSITTGENGRKCLKRLRSKSNPLSDSSSDDSQSDSLPQHSNHFVRSRATSLTSSGSAGLVTAERKDSPKARGNSSTSACDSSTDDSLSRRRKDVMAGFNTSNNARNFSPSARSEGSNKVSSQDEPGEVGTSHESKPKSRLGGRNRSNTSFRLTKRNGKKPKKNLKGMLGGTSDVHSSRADESVGEMTVLHNTANNERLLGSFHSRRETGGKIVKQSGHETATLSLPLTSDRAIENVQTKPWEVRHEDDRRRHILVSKYGSDHVEIDEVETISQGKRIDHDGVVAEVEGLQNDSFVDSKTRRLCRVSVSDTDDDLSEDSSSHSRKTSTCLKVRTKGTSRNEEEGRARSLVKTRVSDGDRSIQTKTMSDRQELFNVLTNASRNFRSAPSPVSGELYDSASSQENCRPTKPLFFERKKRSPNKKYMADSSFENDDFTSPLPSGLYTPSATSSSRKKTYGRWSNKSRDSKKKRMKSALR